MEVFRSPHEPFLLAATILLFFQKLTLKDIQNEMFNSPRFEFQ